MKKQIVALLLAALLLLTACGGPAKTPEAASAEGSAEAAAPKK